jgi:hypothetical protein
VKEKNSLGDLGVDGRIILKWTLKWITKACDLDSYVRDRLGKMQKAP